DLEADLGVDTVKQAEVFAAVRAHYGVERDDTLQLRDFPTITHVAAWIRAKTAGEPSPATSASNGAPADAGSAAAAGRRPEAATVQGDLTATDTLPRRIPVPVLRPSLQRCLPTGVDLAGSRVVVMLDEGGVGEALVKRLEKAGAAPLTLAAGIPTEELSAQLDAWRADGPVDGVYWLAALDDEGDHEALDLAGWTEALRRRVKALFTTMRRMWDAAPFLVCATRLGGQHGYGSQGATSPMGGAVTGFAKSYQKERPQTLVKAVDLPASRKTAAVADLLIEETLRDPGCVEVGRLDELRWGVGYTEVAFPALTEDGSPDGDGGMPLTADSVFLVTGAAGSIVSAITADLAAVSGGTFHLLDLTPVPDPEDPDLAAFRADKDALKVRIAERMKQAGERPTPVAIERELSALERRAAALSAIQAVQTAGGTAHYHSVDLTDAQAVAAVMRDVAERSGRIDVLLHAAGLEISRALPDKEPSEFDLVFDVKTTGWFTVWSGAKDLPVGATVVFSSVAGRFGNQGQTDYASANDLLCKVTSAMRRHRPQTRALALDWTAWGGIGMATRGSIPRIMQSAGVSLLPPEAGVAWVRRELAASAYTGEVIVAGELGQMAAEAHPTGGADPGAFAGLGPHGPMTGEVSLSTADGLVVRTTLDPARQPFLHDHRIDGTAVLPGVMGIEAFAEAAGLAAPAGYRIESVEDVHFLAPLKFFRDDPRTVTVTARVEPAGEAPGLLARCALTAERMLPGQDTPTRTTHFTGTVRLVPHDAPERPTEVAPVSTQPTQPSLGPADVYAFYFHGPAYQVVEEGWREGDRAVSRLTDPLPPNHDPADAPLRIAPRLAELCFQTAGLWEAATQDRMALPTAVGRLHVLRDPAQASGPLYAWARSTGESSFDCAVIDAEGMPVVVMDGYRSVALPTPLPAQVVGRLHATFAVEAPTDQDGAVGPAAAE
ncbi:MAG: SDR family NAD(P)-dependent oxidoreductase, partial [Dermatophilaceae bacterium]